LIVWKAVIERVTVIKFRMDNGGDSGADCFEVEIWADTAKCSDLVKILIKALRQKKGAVHVLDKESHC